MRCINRSEMENPHEEALRRGTKVTLPKSLMISEGKVVPISRRQIQTLTMAS